MSKEIDNHTDRTSEQPPFLDFYSFNQGCFTAGQHNLDRNQSTAGFIELTDPYQFNQSSVLEKAMPPNSVPSFEWKVVSTDKVKDNSASTVFSNDVSPVVASYWRNQGARHAGKR